MSEELSTSLITYKLQLQQVENALLSDESNEDLYKLKTDLEEVINITQSLLTTEKPAEKHNWKVGDRCDAMMSKDNQFHSGFIEEVLDNGTCSVKFDSKYTEIVKVELIKLMDDKTKSKKNIFQTQREYKRKKTLKKKEKLKEEEERREVDKNKWKDFNAKISTKTSKGMVKKSIFASPDTVIGRVGVGTCGISGKPMTKFCHTEKIMKGNRD